MRSLASPKTFVEFRQRVKRSYGLGRITLRQHNVALVLTDLLEKVVGDAKYADRLQLEVKENANGHAAK